MHLEIFLDICSNCLYFWFSSGSTWRSSLMKRGRINWLNVWTLWMLLLGLMKTMRMMSEEFLASKFYPSLFFSYIWSYCQFWELHLLHFCSFNCYSLSNDCIIVRNTCNYIFGLVLSLACFIMAIKVSTNSFSGSCILSKRSLIYNVVSTFCLHNMNL